MPLSIARHRRFAWLEYQDAEDGVTFNATFSDAAMGWKNLFEQLRASGPLRVDDANPKLTIRYTPSRTPGQRPGLVAFPPQESTLFLMQWINNPGINATDSKLTFGSDATDWADVVVVSGHGTEGAVFGEGQPSKKFAFLPVTSGIARFRDLAVNDNPKYLILPCCFNAADEMAAAWLWAFRRTPPVRGILGYSGAYPGDNTGAQVMSEFGKAMQADPSATILQAWARANASLEWGAIVLEDAAKGDTAEKWQKDELPALPADPKPFHYDRDSFPAGVPVTDATPPYEVFFVNAKGTELNPVNNAMHPDVGTPLGLTPGEAMKLRIRARGGNDLIFSSKVTIVFYFYRPQRTEMDLDALLTFDPALFKSDSALGVPKLGLVKDANPRKTARTGLFDAIEYVISDSERLSAEINFTVKTDAASHYKSDGAGSGTHGRFYVRFYPSGQLPSNRADGYSMYGNGAWLRAPP